MKRILVAAAFLFTACHNNDLDTQKDVVVTDTAGMYKSNASTDTALKNQGLNNTEPQVITETRTVYVDRRPKTTRRATTTKTNSQSQSNTTQANSTNQSEGVNTANSGTVSTPTSQPAEKKGWNNSTKGAVIGGVGGAVVGAVISKKKGTGAVIGGVLGAAGGYILGKKKDKAQGTK